MRRAGQVYLRPQKEQAVLQRGGHRKIIFRSLLLWGFARAQEMVSVSVLTVIRLNCGPEPDSTTLMRMRVIPGLTKKCDEGLLGLLFEMQT